MRACGGSWWELGWGNGSSAARRGRERGEAARRGAQTERVARAAHTVCWGRLVRSCAWLATDRGSCGGQACWPAHPRVAPAAAAHQRRPMRPSRPATHTGGAPGLPSRRGVLRSARRERANGARVAPAAGLEESVGCAGRARIAWALITQRQARTGKVLARRLVSETRRTWREGGWGESQTIYGDAFSAMTASGAALSRRRPPFGKMPSRPNRSRQSGSQAVDPAGLKRTMILRIVHTIRTSRSTQEPQVRRPEQTGLRDGGPAVACGIPAPELKAQSAGKTDHPVRRPHARPQPPQACLHRATRPHPGAPRDSPTQHAPPRWQPRRCPSMCGSW